MLTQQSDAEERSTSPSGEECDVQRSTDGGGRVSSGDRAVIASGGATSGGATQ